MAAYLQDEEGLGSSVGAAFLGLCVCCFLPPPSVVVWVLCFLGFGSGFPGSPGGGENPRGCHQAAGGGGAGGAGHGGSGGGGREARAAGERPWGWVQPLSGLGQAGRFQHVAWGRVRQSLGAFVGGGHSGHGFDQAGVRGQDERAAGGGWAGPAGP